MKFEIEDESRRDGGLDEARRYAASLPEGGYVIAFWLEIGDVLSCEANPVADDGGCAICALVIGSKSKAWREAADALSTWSLDVEAVSVERVLSRWFDMESRS